MDGIINERDVTAAEVFLFMVEHHKGLQEAYDQMAIPFDLRMPHEEFKKRIGELVGQLAKI